jgi:hypothetical protein
MTRCHSCGRKLTASASIARSRGRACWAKVGSAARAAALADYSLAQVEAAVELIADAAILNIRPAVYRTVSTDGTETYLTAAKACSCPAGIKGRRCYHRAAAAILDAVADAPAVAARGPIALDGPKPTTLAAGNPFFRVQMWTAPRRRKALYAPEAMLPGASITWTHRYPDGREVERTGQVWSQAPMPRSVWVVPAERLPGDVYGAVVVQQVRSGALTSENLVSSPTGNWAACAANAAHRTRAAQAAAPVEIATAA